MDRKRMMLCCISIALYIVGCFVVFFHSKEWGHMAVVAICGGIFSVIMYRILYCSNYNDSEIVLFIKGMIIIVVINTIVSCICIHHASNISKAFKQVWMNDYSIESRVAKTFENITETCKRVHLGYKRYLTQALFFPLLREKSIYIQKGIENDYRVRLLTGSVIKEYLNMNTLDDSHKVIFSKLPKIETITIEYKKNLAKEIFLLMGDDWENSKAIYIVSDDEGGVWAIPEILVYPSLVSDINNLVNPDKLDYVPDTEIAAMFWEYSNISILRHGEELGFERIFVALNAMMYLLFMFIVGALLLFLYSDNILPDYLILFSFPMGVILEVLGCIFLGLLHMQISLYSLIIFDISVCMLFLIRNNSLGQIIEKWKTLCNESWHKGRYLALIIILICCFFCIVPIWFGGFGDTIRNIFFGQYMVYRGEWGSNFANISAYSLFLPYLSAGATMFEADTMYYFVPILAFISILSIGYLGFNGNSDNTGLRKQYLTASILFVILTPMFLLHGISIMNNLPIGLFFVLALLLILSEDELKYSNRFVLGGIIFIFASCIRIEGPLLGALWIFIMDAALGRKKSLRYATALFGATCCLYVLNYNFFNPENTVFWSPTKGLGVLLVSFLVLIYIFFQPIIITKYKFIHENRFLFINIAMVLLPLLFCSSDYAMVLGNLKAYWYNTFSSGYYGCLWFVLGMLIIFVFSYFETRSRSFIMAEMIFVTFVFGFDIMLFRIYPIKYSYGDSSARMLLHILPSICLFMYYLLDDIKNKQFKSQIQKDL